MIVSHLRNGLVLPPRDQVGPISGGIQWSWNCRGILYECDIRCSNSVDVGSLPWSSDRYPSLNNAHGRTLGSAMNLCVLGAHTTTDCFAAGFSRCALGPCILADIPVRC